MFGGRELRDFHENASSLATVVLASAKGRDIRGHQMRFSDPYSALETDKPLAFETGRLGGREDGAPQGAETHLVPKNEAFPAGAVPSTTYPFI
jgi:hypothetical protein